MFRNMKIRKAKNKLRRYIKHSKKSKEEIMELALKTGWSKEIVEDMLKKIEGNKKKEIEVTIPLVRNVVKNIGVKEEEIEKKPIGIKGQLDSISNTLDVLTNKNKEEIKLKKKSFKLPYKIKSSLKKMAVKNKAMVLLLQGTRNISPVLGERKSGMLVIGENVYDGAVDCTWLWNGKYPTYIF